MNRLKTYLLIFIVAQFLLCLVYKPIFAQIDSVVTYFVLIHEAEIAII